jgi:hypothetical protein
MDARKGVAAHGLANGQPSLITTLEYENMNFTPQSAVQRIQVGLIGLVTVLLFVSIANVISDRSSSDARGPQQTKTSASADAAKSEQRQDEPLAELGVAPAVSEQPQTTKTKPPVN